MNLNNCLKVSYAVLSCMGRKPNNRCLYLVEDNWTVLTVVRENIKQRQSSLYINEILKPNLHSLKN